MRKLTLKQQRFIDFYVGNGADAARKAGYKGNDKTLAVVASKLLNDANIASRIKARESKESRPNIATRKERQEFWTSIMRNKAQSLEDRFRASELLGKSEADFIAVNRQEGEITERIIIEMGDDGGSKDNPPQVSA